MRKRSVPIAWLAIVLVALNALWPLVAQARPKVPGVLVAVCTVDGITHYTELPTPKPPVEQRSDASHEHCKFCIFGADRAFLPTETPQVVASPANEFASPPAQSAPPGSSFHSAARPRAPPVSS